MSEFLRIYREKSYKLLCVFYSIVVDISRTQWMVMNKITFRITLQMILNIYPKCFLAHRICISYIGILNALKLDLLFSIHKMKENLVWLHTSCKYEFQRKSTKQKWSDQPSTACMMTSTLLLREVGVLSSPGFSGKRAIIAEVLQCIRQSG